METPLKAPKSEAKPVKPLRRATVSESLDVDIAHFARRGWWRPDVNIQGTCTWTYGRGETATIGWITSPDELVLHYATTDSHKLTTNHVERIEVLRQVDGVGHQRVWIVCPGCGARVRILYAPAFRGAVRFLCRTCHGLSYRSRQEHKSRYGQVLDRLIRLEERFYRLSRVQRVASPEVDAVLERADALNEQHAAISQQLMTRHKRRYVQPRRGPGRPSKRSLYERQVLERRADRAAIATKPKRPRGRPKVKQPYVRRQPLELTPPSSDREAFCVHCRDRRLLELVETVTLSNGRPALRGHCATCGTRLCRLLSAGRAAG